MPSQINLLPNKKLLNNKGYLYVVSFYAKNVLLVFNALLFLLYGYRFILDRNTSRLTSKNQKIQAEINRYEEKALEYKKYQDLAIFTKKVRSKEIDVLFVLDFLNKSTPTGVSIKGIQISEGKLNIMAESGSPAEFTTFLSLVLQEPRFGSVILTSSQYDEKLDSFSFTLKMSYKYGTG